MAVQSRPAKKGFERASTARWQAPNGPVPRFEDTTLFEAVKGGLPPEPASGFASAPMSEAPRDERWRVSQEPTRSETVATEDVLDRKRLTDALARLLQNRTDDKAFSIALFGHWGSGKSSQIELLRQRLDPARFVFADFNAWRNERVDNIGAALAQTIVESLVHGAGYIAQLRLAVRLSVRRKKRLKHALSRDLATAQAAGYSIVAAYAPLLVWPLLAGLAFWLVLIRVDTHEVLNFIASAAAAVWALFMRAQRLVTKDLLDWFKRIATPASGVLLLPDYSEKLGSFHDINRTLDDLCALTLDAGEGHAAGKTLLVIVDDLDRCAPATVKQMFDAVRLVASIPRVVVLVALDERIAFSAVEKHYAEYGDTGREPAQVARDYLAKVFQVSVTLPPIDGAAVDRYIRAKLFNQQLQEAQDDEGPDGDASAPAVPPDAPPTPKEIEAFIAVALDCGITNPRELWRMRQSWSLLKGVGLTDAVDDAQIQAWLRHLFECEKALQGTAAERQQAQQQVLDAADHAFVLRERVIRMVLLPASDAAP